MKHSTFFVKSQLRNLSKKVKKLYLSRNLQERFQKQHGAKVDFAFQGWTDVWLHPDFSEWNIEECLPKIRVPQLIVQRNDDEYETSTQIEAFVSQSDNSVETFFLDNFGQPTHLEQEIQTLEWMNKFVRNLYV